MTALGGWWAVPVVILLLGLLVALRQGWMYPVAGSMARLALRGEALAARVRAVLVARLRREHAHRFGQHWYYRLRDYEQWLDARQWEFIRLCRDVRERLAELRREVRGSEPDFPDAPTWVAAVDAVARLPGEHHNHETVKVLDRLARMARRQHEETLREYRWAAAVRQRVLARNEPHWRRIRRDTTRMRRLLRKLAQRRQALEIYEGARAVAEQGIPGPGVGLLLAAIGWWLVLALALVGALFCAVLLTQALPENSLPSGMSGALVGFYLTALMLGGVVVGACLRWLPLPRLIVTLTRSWRLWLAAGTAGLLGALAVSGMGQSLASSATQLAGAGWSPLSAWLLSATLLLAPLATAALLPSLYRALKSTRMALLFVAWGAVRAAARALAGLANQLSRVPGRRAEEQLVEEAPAAGSTARELDPKAASGQ